MKEFKLRFTADVADIEAQFKGAAKELKQFAAGVASAENQLEALQQTGAYLTQMDKQLSELKKKYPDIFKQIFGNVDAQMKAALEPLMKSPQMVGKAVKQIGDQLSGISTGKLEATNTEMQQLGKTVKLLADAMGMQADLDFLNGTDKARLKAQKLIDVLGNLAVAYYKLDKASEKTDLGTLSAKVKEEKPKNKPKSKQQSAKKPAQAEDPTPVPVVEHLKNVNNELENQIDELEKQRVRYQEIIDVITGENLDLRLKTTKKTDEQQLKDLVNQFNEATEAVRKFEAANDTSGDAYKKALGEQYRLATLVKNTMDYVSESGSAKGEKYVVSQIGSGGVYDQAEKIIDSLKTSVAASIQKVVQGEIDSLTDGINKIKEAAKEPLKDSSVNVEAETKAAEAARIKAEEEEKARIAAEQSAKEAEKARLATEAQAKAAHEAAEAAKLKAEAEERARDSAKQLDEASKGQNARTENALFYDSKTGKSSDVIIGGNHNVSFDWSKYKNLQYDTEMHSHPFDVAAPSVEDFDVWINNFNEFKKFAIRANKEILSLDFSSLDADGLKVIRDKYAEMVSNIEKEFIANKPDNILEPGAYEKWQNNFQAAMKNALAGIISPDMFSTIDFQKVVEPIKNSNISIPLAEQYKNATEEVRNLVNELAKLDDLDETDEIAAKWNRLAEIAPNVYKSMRGDEWERLKQQILEVTSAAENAKTAIGSDGTVIPIEGSGAEKEKEIAQELITLKEKLNSIPTNPVDATELDIAQKEVKDLREEVLRLEGALDSWKSSYYDMQESLDRSVSISELDNMTPNDVVDSYRSKIEQLSNEVVDLTNTLAQVQSASGTGFDNSAEIQMYEALKQKLIEVRAEIDAKTEAFKNEGTVVDTVVAQEIAKLNTLKEKVQKIVDNIKNISNESSSNKRLLTDFQGNDLFMYRGTRDVDGGLLSHRSSGTFFTDNIELAKDYAGELGKIEKVQLAMNNPLEIDANGASWDKITYIGEGFDEASKKIYELLDAIKELEKKKKVLIMNKGEFSNDAMAVGREIVEKKKELQKIYDDDSNPYKGNATTDDFAIAAKQLGYDGLIIHNVKDNVKAYHDAGTVMVAFTEDNIKHIETLSALSSSAIKDNINEAVKTTDEAKKKVSAPLEGKPLKGEQTAMNLDTSTQDVKEHVAAEEQVNDALDKQIAKKKELKSLDSNKEKLSQSIQDFQSKLNMDFVSQDSVQKIADMKQKLDAVTNGDELNAWKQEWSEVSKSISQAAKEQEGLALSSQKIKLNGMKNSMTNAYKGASIDIDKATDEQKAFAQSYDDLSSKLTFYAKNRRVLSNEEMAALEREAKAIKEKANAYAKQAEEQKKAENAYGTKEINSATSKREAITGVATSNRFANSQTVIAALRQMNAAYDALIAKQKEFKPGEETEADRIAFQKLTDDFNRAHAALKELVNSSDKLSKNANWSKSLSPDVDVSTYDRMKSALEGAIRSSEDGKIKIDDFRYSMKELDYSVQNQDGSWSHFTARLNSAGTEIVGLNSRLKQTDGLFKRIFSGASEKFMQALTRFTGFDVFYKGINEIRRGVQYVKEIDSALTELKKVTDETDESYANFLQTLAQTGTEIGATVSDLTNMAASWARLGYSMQEAGELARSTAVLLNVSEFTDAEKASEALISTIQAYGYAAEDSMRVVDVLNEIGNNFAISSDGIATALQDSASALMAAGNNLEQSVAMVAAANKVLQDPNSVGSSLRTISLRIRGTSVKVLEEMGEETDGVIESVSKLQAKIKGLTGVNILNDDGGYKDTYTIIKEIAEVWNELTDINKAATLELLAGKNRSNAMAAMLTNIEDLTAAYEDAMDAEGSAMAENEKYLDSIQGRIDQFTNAVQTMWNNALGSDIIKMIVSLGTALIKLVDTLGLIPSILITIAAFKFGKIFLPEVWGTLKNAILANIAAITGEITAVEALNAALVKQAIETSGLSIAKKQALLNTIMSTTAEGEETLSTEANTAAKLRNLIATSSLSAEEKAKLLTDLGLITSNGAVAVSFDVLTASIWATIKAFGAFLVTNPVGWVILLTGAIIGVSAIMNKLIKTHEDYVQEIEESSDKINEIKDNITNLNKELEETREKIFDLEHADKLSFTEQAELDRLKKQNAELERTIALEERKKELEEKKRAKAYVNAAKTDTTLNASTTVYRDSEGNYTTASQATDTFNSRDTQVLKTGYTKETVSILEGKIAEEQRTREAYEKAQKEYEDALNSNETSDKELKQLETRLNNSKEAYDNAAEDITNTLDEIEEKYGDIEWYPDAEAGSWQEENNKVYKQVFDFYDQLAIKSDTTGKAVESAFNRIAGMGQFGDQIEKIEETAGITGEALRNMLSFEDEDEGILTSSTEGMNGFVQSLIDCGVISDASAESLQKVVDLTLQTSSNSSNAAVANQKLARSQKMLQYYKLYKELNQYTKKLKNTRDDTGQLTNKYKEQITLIRQKMVALAQEISKYDILSAKIAEAKKSFDEFESAKTADSDSDYLNKTGEMFQDIISGFQSAEMGSEIFKSAFASLIPESVYKDLDTLTEKYDAAAKYISETLNRYMNVEYDDDGTIKSVETTSKNIQTFIKDAKAKGLMNFADGIWTVNEPDFDTFAEKMGLTKEMLLAIGTQIDKMDADWIMGDMTSFFDSFDMDTEQNIYRAVQNLAFLDQKMTDGKISAEEYAKAYAEYNQVISDNSKNALSEIEEYTEKTKAVDDLTQKVETAKANLEALKNSGASEAEINIATDDLTTLMTQLGEALAAKGDLTAPSELVITVAQEYITNQLDALQTQLQTREWFITPVLKDDGTIESELFELGEDGKYQIKANITIPEDDRALVDEYLNALNGAKTLGVYLKDENDAQGKADKLQTTAENIDEVLNSLKAQIDVSGAIAALEELKTEIDSLKNIKVNVTTEKKTGFWDWLTGGRNQVNTTPQRNTSNSRQYTQFQGTAHATGNWGLSQDEHDSLVGELGQELVVDPKTGKYYTVGDNGAELVDLPKDAIIFNHKQTEALFKNGHINTRGQAYVNGNAHAGTSGTIFTRYTIPAAYGGAVPNYQGYSDVLQHLDTIADTVDDASSDAKDEFEELFDWFDILITEIDQSIDLITAKIENTVGASAKNSLYQQVVDLNYGKMTALNKGIVLYSNKAQEFLNQIPQAYREMAKNGAVALTDFQGEANEKVLEAIKNYREWKDKAAELNVELQNIKKNISDINVQMLENISTEYENKIGLITNLNDRIQKQIDLQEESGKRLSEGYYLEMIKNARTALNLQKEQRKEMQAQLSRSVASGDVLKYSEDWFNMVNAINDVDEAIVQSQIDIESFQNSINDLHWENFERLVKAIENVSDEAEHLRNLIKDDDLTDDAGNWTEKGITALGLASQEMENAKYRSELYGKEIKQLKRDYKAGLYTQDEYNDKLQELKSSQWDCIEAYESAKDTIIELNKTRIEVVKDGIQKEIDAYEKLINKRKEDLSAQKDQHDWAKTVKEHTTEIDSIQRKLDALNGDTSASAAAQRKKLQEELANAQQELEETYYDHEIEMQQKALDETLELYKEDKEKKMEELDEYLKKEEKVLTDSSQLVLNNANVVYKTLNGLAGEYGIEITNAVVEPWKKGTGALSTYGQNLSAATSGYIAQLKLIESELANIQIQADRTAASLISMINYQARMAQGSIGNGNGYYAPSGSSNTGTGSVGGGNSISTSVGSSVTVKSSATNFSRDGGNGTKMQSWVPGSTFTVMQESGDEVLIGRNGGYTGWVKKSDLVGYGVVSNSNSFGSSYNGQHDNDPNVSVSRDNTGTVHYSGYGITDTFGFTNSGYNSSWLQKTPYGTNYANGTASSDDGIDYAIYDGAQNYVGRINALTGKYTANNSYGIIDDYSRSFLDSAAKQLSASGSNRNSHSGGGSSSSGGRGSSSGGETKSNQQRYLENLASNGNYGQREWAKNELKHKRYATGTTSVKANELAWIDEHGLEEIVMHADGGKLAYLTKGSAVLPHDISENLMKIGSVDYRTILDKNRPTVGTPYVTENNMQIDMNIGEVVHIEHADRDSISDIQAAVEKQLNSYMKQLNSCIKKYSR